MRRRTLLAAGLAGLSALLSGCLDRVVASGPDRRSLPEHPPPLDTGAAVEFATEYSEVSAYNERVGSTDGLETLEYDCEGILDAAIEDGYVVLTNCAWSATVSEGLARSSSAHGFDGPTAVHVDRSAVTTASVSVADRDVPEPPYESRAVHLVNFSGEQTDLDLRVVEDDVEGETNGDAIFGDQLSLGPRSGRLLPAVVSGSGEYVIELSAGDSRSTRRDWRVDDAPRPSTRIAEFEAGEIGLGAYVLPDGSLALASVSPPRPEA